MEIVSVEEIVLEPEPLMACVPHLEVVKAEDAHAGLDWRFQDPGSTIAFEPRREESSFVEVLDLPYSLDRSQLFSYGEREVTFDIHGAGDLGASGGLGSLSMSTLPGLAHADMWSVTGAGMVGDGYGEIALERPGGGSFVAATYEDDLPALEQGTAVLGMDKILGQLETTNPTAGMALHTPVDLGTKYLLRFLKVQVDFVPDRPSAELDAWVPLARVHCPERAGCRAELGRSRTEGSARTSTLGVLGNKGMSEHLIELRMGDGLSAEPGECAELAVRGRLMVETGTTRLEGDPVSYGLRLTVKSIDTNDQAERPIPERHDDCGWPVDQLPDEAWRRDRSAVETEPSQESTFSKEIEEETSGTLSVGLELDNLPISLGLEFKRTAKQRDIVSAWLAPGARYAAYQPGADRAMEWCWTVY